MYSEERVFKSDPYAEEEDEKSEERGERKERVQRDGKEGGDREKVCDSLQGNEACPETKAIGGNRVVFLNGCMFLASRVE